MKKLVSIILILFSINTFILILPEKATAQSVSFQAFYDDLSPYGTWFENPDYGYVWRPGMRSGFTPYSSNGYWVLTDAGWTWISDYSWGWAPFHYGRWYNDPSYGYVWVPGYEWGPGWVSWRRSNDYYGWAPIGPGVDINIAYGNGYNIPYNQWNFIRCRDFGRRNMNNYYLNRSRNVTVINNTTVINNVYVDNTRNTRYNLGPDRTEVQKVIGRPVKPITIEDQAKPAQHANNTSVQLYRPKILNIQDAPTKPAPAKITPLNEIKPVTVIPRVKNQPSGTRPDPASPSPVPVKPKVDQQPLPVQHSPNPTINDQPIQNSHQQPVPRIKQPVKQQPVNDPQSSIQPVPSRPTRTPRNINAQPQQTPSRPPVQQPREINDQPNQNVNPPVRVQEPVRQQPQKQQDAVPAPSRQQPVHRAPVQRPTPSAPQGRRLRS